MGLKEDPRIPVDIQKTFSLRYGHTLKDSDNPCVNGMERCVVSFGLYGSNPFYLDGLLRNIQLAPIYWRGWRLRIYVDESVPDDFRRRLKTPISETVLVKNVTGFIAGMFWRFFVANDPHVDRFLVRDTDGGPTPRERDAIAEWILSGRRWHSITDHPAHEGWPMLGGLFGGRKEKIGHGTPAALPYEMVEGLIRSGKVDHLMQFKGGDQTFLELYVWPTFKRHTSDLLIHSSYHCLVSPSSIPFPTRRMTIMDFVGAPIPAKLLDSQVLSNLRNGGYPPWITDTETADGTRLGEVECPLACRPLEHQDWKFC